MSRWTVVAASALLLVALPRTSAARDAHGPAPQGGVLQSVVSPTAAVVYASPLPGPLRVVRTFDPPVALYGPGHLGVDLRVSDGAQIVAAGDGVVRFAGPVAGRGVVVIQHADGVATEYEPVRALVRVGATVRRGQVIAVLDGAHPGCPGRCLHWGARRAGAYLDPLSLLRRLGVVRLLPWHTGPP
jgi:murein DD-endopeptidase MepM/ murein hydrolase activator NlpD